MQKTFCDRCGRDITDEVVYRVVSDSNLPPFGSGYTSRSYELCATCKTAFDEFISNKPTVVVIPPEKED